MLKIEVTKEDIKNGWKISPRNCPVAKAIQRLLPTASVGLGTLYLNEGNDKYILPDCVSKFILAFDRDQEVSPFSFELNLEECKVALY